MKRTFLSILQGVFIISLFVSCNQNKVEQTLTLDPIREMTTTFFREIIPGSYPIRTADSERLLRIYLDEIEKYEKIDSVVPGKYFTGKITEVETKLMSEMINDPQSRQFTNIFIHHLGKHNHMKTHKDLKEFPSSISKFLMVNYYDETMDERSNEIRELFGEQLDLIKEQDLINEETFEAIKQQIEKDIQYFTKAGILSDKDISIKVTESSSYFVLCGANETVLYLLKPVYNEFKELNSYKEKYLTLLNEEMEDSDYSYFTTEYFSQHYSSTFQYDLYLLTEIGEITPEQSDEAKKIVEHIENKICQAGSKQVDELKVTILSDLDFFRDMVSVIDYPLIHYIFYLGKLHDIDLLHELTEWLEQKPEVDFSTEFDMANYPYDLI